MPAKKRGGLYCSCYGPNNASCTNTSYTEDVSMHLFPVNSELRQKWIDFVSVHRPGFEPSRFSAVCSRHFEESCYHQRFIKTFPELNGDPTETAKRKKRLDRECGVPTIVTPLNSFQNIKAVEPAAKLDNKALDSVTKRVAKFGKKAKSKKSKLRSSRKTRHVVQQLKQNIQPRSEVYSNEQEFSPTYHHNQMQSANHDGRIRRDRSPRSIMNNTRSISRPPAIATDGHSGHSSRISPTPRAKFFPNITQNNIVHLKKEPPLTRKPDMITTGMQTVPTPKNDSMRLKAILPKPETTKLKVSLGIQTSKPEQQTGKQNAEKLNFLSTLGLITVSKCREINSQKNERRRRTSAIFSPYSSFQFFDEPKRSSTGIKRGRGRPTKNGDSSLKSPISPSPVFVPINGFKTPNDEPRSDGQITRNLSSTTSPKAEEHEDHCAVCQQSGEVLMCDTCILVFHLKCLSPPLTRIPTGMWMCPKCQESIKNKEPMEWPGTLAVAHSYLKHRAEKDREKQNLLCRNQELKLQELELQRKVNELSSAIVTQIQKKTEIVESTKQAQEKFQKLKKFIQTVHSS